MFIEPSASQTLRSSACVESCPQMGLAPDYQVTTPPVFILSHSLPAGALGVKGREKWSTHEFLAHSLMEELLQAPEF